MNYFSQRKTIFYSGLLGLWIVIGGVTGLLRTGEALAKSDPLRRPWPVRGGSSVGSEVLAAPSRKLKPVSENSFWQESFLQAIRLFQLFISPADGDRCPMSPSCSQYAMEAIRTCGPWRGALMTSDRLLRCGREDDYPLIQNQGKFQYYDPVGENTLWP